MLVSICSFHRAMDELQPANALYLVQGEISCIVTEMKRSIRSSSHSPVSYSSLSLS